MSYSDLRSVMSSAVLVGGGSVVSKVLSYSAESFFARTLTVSNFGSALFTYTLLITISGILLLGIPEGVTHYVARYNNHNDSHLINQILIFSFSIITGVGLISLTLLLIFRNQIAKIVSTTSPRLLILLSPIIIFYVLSRTGIAVVRGLGLSIPKVVFDDVFNKLIALSVSIIVISYLLDYPLFTVPIYYAGQYAISATFMICSLLLFLFKKYNLRLDLTDSYNTAVELLRYSLPLIIKNIFGRLLGNTGILIVGIVLSSTAAGYFRVGYVISQLPLIIPISLYYLYNPTQTQLLSENKNAKANRLYANISKISVLLIIPITAFLITWSGQIITILFDERYTNGSIVLVILSIDVFIRSTFGPAGETLEAYGDTKTESYSVIVSTIFTIISGVILAIHIGYEGVATATLLGVFILNVIRMTYLYRHRHMEPLSSAHFIHSSLVLGFTMTAALFAQHVFIFRSFTDLLFLGSLAICLLFVATGVSAFVIGFIKKENIIALSSVIFN